MSLVLNSFGAQTIGEVPARDVPRLYVPLPVVRRLSFVPKVVPVPVVNVQRESVHLGGAANVLANLISLGAQASVTGTLDPATRTIKVASIEPAK